jgi:hypothetical protein
LFRERTLRAIGIILHAKILIDLQQALLVRNATQKLFLPRVVSKETYRRDVEAAIR